MRFQSTPSARRATNYNKTDYKKVKISIHALREEGDPVFLVGRLKPTYFNPRPPRGGRRPGILRKRPSGQISIHALREEGDHQECGSACP